MSMWAQYGLFTLKILTVLIALVIVIVVIAGASSKGQDKGQIKVTKLNKKLDQYKSLVNDAVLGKDELKQLKKDKKQQDKQDKQNKSAAKPQRAFVLSFNGDMKASQVSAFREEITALLASAKPEDEVIVKLESPGGMVHGYGLAASQMQRIKDHGLSLTAVVDKVAASGGYMMACVADKIVAAPFSIIGSIGVVAQVPNIHRLLKKNDVDVEVLTAGKYKRTLTIMGENTDEGREKFKQDLEDTHGLFKHFVGKHRRRLDIEEVANGDIWYGQDAVDNNLVDEIGTSDDYINKTCQGKDVFLIEYEVKKSITDKIGKSVSTGIENATFKLMQSQHWIK